MLNRKFKNNKLFLFSILFFAFLFFFSCRTHKEKEEKLKAIGISKQKEEKIIIPEQKIFTHIRKTLYTNNRIVNLTNFICPHEFCMLYIVKNKRIYQTKVFANNESVLIEFETEGTYYLKLVKRDEQPPKRLKDFDYKIIFDKTKPIILIKPTNLHKQIFRGNTTIKICYQSYDKHPKSISAWFYDTFKKKSNILSNNLPKKGCSNFLLPNYSTTLDFYFKAKDKSKNFSPEEKLTIYVDSEPPHLLFNIPKIINTNNVSISYTSFDRGMAGFNFIEVYVESPASRLQKVGTYYNFKDTIEYNLNKEGIYKFILKAYDKVGNAQISEEKFLIFDETSPKITVKEGFDKNLFYSEEIVKLKIDIEEEYPDNNTLQLFLSENLGKQWKKIEYNKTDDIVYFKIPNIQTQNAILRIEIKDKAQNVSNWESSVFSIDNTIPFCEIIGDNLEFNTNNFAISYKITKKGFITPDEVKVFYKSTDSKVFTPYNLIFKYGEKIDLTLSNGKYLIGVICINTELEKVNRIQKLEDTKFIELLVDSESPKLLSISKLKKYYKNGDNIDLKWHFTDDNPNNDTQVKIAISYDNKTYTYLNKNFNYMDELLYSITGISNKIIFRVEAWDKLGNTTRVVKKIKIDNNPPSYTFHIKKISNILTIPYELKLYDKGSGIKNAIILIKKRDEREWKTADTINFVKNKKGIINVRESGYFFVKVEAYDRAGNVSNPNNFKGFDEEILVDNDTPQLSIQTDKIQYYIGETCKIKIKSQDNIGIKQTQILISKDNQPFKVIENNYTAGIYEYRFKEIGTYHFKVEIVDYAGNFITKSLKIEVRKPNLNFPCKLPSIIKNKLFSLPCKFEVDTNVIKGIYIYLKKDTENEYKEFAEYSPDKNFSFPEGCFNIDFIGKDIEGNIGNIGATSSSVCFIYTPPFIKLLAPIKTLYNGNDLFIELKWIYQSPALDKNSLSLEYSIDNGKTYKNILNKANISDKFKFPFSNLRNFEGYVNFRVSIEDLGGNQSRNEISNIYYDDIPPRIKILGEFKQWYGKNELLMLQYCIEDASNNLDIKLYSKTIDNEYKILKTGLLKCDSINLSLKDGFKKIFKIVAVDATSNINYAETPVISVDTTPPIIKLHFLPQAKEKDVSIKIETDDKESGVRKTEIYIKDNSKTEKIGEFTNNIPLEFRHTVTEDGYYEFFVVSTDNVGNTAQSETKKVLVDSSKPTIDITKINTNKIYFCGLPYNLEINIKDNIGIDYVKIIAYTDDKQDVINKNLKLEGLKEYKYTIPLTTNICNNLLFNIKVYDLVGHENTTQFTLKYEKTIPNITFSSNLKKWYSPEDKIELKFCVEDKTNNLDIKLYQKTDEIDYFLVQEGLQPCDNINVRLIKAKKYNRFKIVAKNATGNIKYFETQDILIDNTKPAIAFYAPSATTTNTIEFNIKADDNESGVKNTIIYSIDHTNTKVKIKELEGNIDKKFDHTIVKDGYYEFFAVSTDNVGNTAQSETKKVLVDSSKPAINIKTIPQKTYICGASVTLKLEFYDNIGIEYVKVFIDRDRKKEVIIDETSKLNGKTQHIFEETLTNPLNNCKNYNVFVEVKDIAGNIESKTFILNTIQPVLAYNVDFESTDVKSGIISYKIKIPDLEKSVINRLELLGRKEQSAIFKSYGITKEEGIIQLEEGCYEFIAIGCLENNICGNTDDIKKWTRICVHDKPKIYLNFTKSFDIYSNTNKLEFDYKISNFKEGALKYSLDGKQYQLYSKLDEYGTTSFSLPHNFEGIISFLIEAENKLGEEVSRTFQIRFDNVLPQIYYTWNSLKSTIYPKDFKDILKVQCIDKFLTASSLKIYYRNNENNVFSLMKETHNNFSYNFNFTNIDKIQFKFYCSDSAGNHTSIETPFYTMDKTPPEIKYTCKLTKENNMINLNIQFNIIENQSGIEKINVLSYKNDRFHNLLYTGTENSKELNIKISEEGKFNIEIFSQDITANSSTARSDNCTFYIDLTPPKLKINLPSTLKSPSNKVVEVSFSASDNQKIQKVELLEQVLGKGNLLYTSKDNSGIFKILPENRENTRKFVITAYDDSENITSLSFTIIYKQLNLSYKIENDQYITDNSFSVQYELTDDIDLIEDVILFYKQYQEGDFIKYGSVLKDKNVLLPDGCYIFSIVGKSKLQDIGDKNKFPTKICIITKRPQIEITSSESVFYGKEFVRIPFSITSLEIAEVKVWWSSDKGLSWHRIEEKFTPQDEVILKPDYEGQIYLKIYAKNKANFENELIIKDIFISTKPPICNVNNNLQFRSKNVSFKFEVEEKYIPTKRVTIIIYKNNIEVSSINKDSKEGTIKIELPEGIYTAECQVIDMVGNSSKTSLGEVIVDITEPKVIIEQLEITTVERNTAKIKLQYNYDDNTIKNPSSIEVFVYSFTTKKWKNASSFKNVLSSGSLEISVNLFGRFSIGISAKDAVGNQYMDEAIKENRPTKHILNLIKPKPKLYAPLKNQIILFGDSLIIKWDCKSKKSNLVDSTNIYVTDKNHKVVANIISDYPLQGEYTYFPVLESGEYLLTLACKGKFGIEFKTTKKFYILDKLPTIKIEPITK